MAHDDRPLPQPLGPSRPHIVPAEHLRERRTGLPRDDRGWPARERDRGQDDVTNGISERVPVPGEEAIDYEQVSHRWWHDEPGIDPSRDRHPPEAHGEDDYQDHAEPERRH